MISEDSINRLKASLDIVDVIGDIIKLKKSGSDYEALCPFHNERTASFKVSRDKGIYKCFGCGETGNAIDFVMKYKSEDFNTVIKELAGKYHIGLEQDSKAYRKPVLALKKLSDSTIQYFESRGISNNTLLRHSIGETDKSIAFPYYQDTEIITAKHRSKTEKAFWLESGTKLIFYNLDSVKGEKECVIFEGEIDCLSGYEAGVYSCVSVPNGAANGKLQLQYVDNCYQYFEGIEKIVLAVDNDVPGKNLMRELCRRFGPERCFTVEYPEGCKDANDVLVKHGKGVLKQVIEAAKPIPLEGIITPNDVLDHVRDYYDNGYPQGCKAYIPNFDELLRFAFGQMTIITGIPGSGKDEFLNYISTQLARYHRWKFGISGFEEPAAYTITKLQEKLTNKSFAFRKDVSKRINEQEFQASFEFINEHFFFIDIEQTGAEIDKILSKAAELVKRYGINALIINPWSCIEHKRPANQTETEYVCESMTKMINFCLRYNVHLFLIAHTTKIQKSQLTKKYEIPTLYSISGSAHFFNKTHNGITVYRDFEKGITEVFIQKVKQSWLGKLGSCCFNFDTETREYIPIIQ
ncbi:MAG TPA: CHC2 zinc finger domain-containing protein [Parafilimonas sp.]|nr:CHC2 zinc finger domain-containing protein [Parafilimonas sp.]